MTSVYALFVSVVLYSQGNVESWLAELLTVTRLSVHDVIRSASIAINDTNFKLLEFEKGFPAQVPISSLLFIAIHSIILANVNIRYNMLSQSHVRLSSVCNVHTPYSAG